MILIRGDNESVKIKFTKNGVPYTPNDLKDGDIFTFTIRDAYTKKSIYQNQIIYPELEFNIKSEESETFKLGHHIYDIEYRNNEGVVKTIIKADIEITEDVTY